MEPKINSNKRERIEIVEIYLPKGQKPLIATVYKNRIIVSVKYGAKSQSK